ncbi:MAG: uroporphyrinogen-III C-methyltransferase [Methylotenera sp.]|nr:uroporphyrinogen-III C-methyltransferase [Methylotenera sp.]
MTNQAEPLFVEKRKPSMMAVATIILVIIAIFTLAWQWLNTRHRFNEIEKTLSIKLEKYQALNQQSLALAKQAEERSTQANARTIILEQKLAESRDQQEALQTLYTQLAENRESTAVAEVEQLLTIAKQQLQLAGNVKSALLALEAADQRLQPIELPRAISLRETLHLEIESLRELPQIDLIGISAQLTYLTELSSSLPLISERQPIENNLAYQSSVMGNSAEPVSFWQRMWQEVSSLVTVERIDRPEPPLLAPDHALYLRENIKLRLLTARIALLQHDDATFKADLNTVKTWLNQYFDTQHQDTISAFRLLNKLSSHNINIELPQLNNSLAAVNRYKLLLEKSE